MISIVRNMRLSSRANDGQTKDIHPARCNPGIVFYRRGTIPAAVGLLALGLDENRWAGNISIPSKTGNDK
jgi:hypothetical protein